MNRKTWNRLKPSQRLSILYINNMDYYPYHNKDFRRLIEPYYKLIRQGIH